MEISPPKWQKQISDSIALCMIMKNEEKLLPRCLDSIQGLVDEIIIVDTGSTDNSIRIARDRGCTVLEDPWQDDFARPRNIGIRKAKSNWILILDGDEVIARADHDTIREHTLHPKIKAYRMDTRNYTDNPWMSNNRPNPKDYFAARRFYGFVPSTKTRLFQNHHDIFFRGCWHELLDYDVRDKKYTFSISPVPIHHYPHEINQANVAEKQIFYLRLGRKKVRLNPEDTQAWWELAIAEHISGFHNNAYRAALFAMRKGGYDHERLFFLAAVAKQSGHPAAQAIAFEKAVCQLYPNLTHVDTTKKTPLHAAPSTA